MDRDGYDEEKFYQQICENIDDFFPKQNWWNFIACNIVYPNRIMVVFIGLIVVVKFKRNNMKLHCIFFICRSSEQYDFTYRCQIYTLIISASWFGDCFYLEILVFRSIMFYFSGIIVFFQTHLVKWIVISH